MRIVRVLPVLPALACLLAASAGMAAEPAPDFDRQIAPLLAGRCLDCHSGSEPKGGLDLSTQKGASQGGDSGPGVVPGKLTASQVWERVAAGDMPPKKPLPELTLPGATGINVCVADGSIRFIDPGRMSEKTLKAAITANGGEVLGPDW